MKWLPTMELSANLLRLKRVNEVKDWVETSTDPKQLCLVFILSTTIN